MSKPKDIPQDVWEAAVPAAKRANECCHRSDGFEDDIHESIARAILAERERCAKVAEKHASPGQMWERDEMPTAKLAAGYAARDIADDIRSGAQP